jgi:hypothetical protein
MPLKKPTDKTSSTSWTLLKDQALPYFEHYLSRRLEPKDSDLPDNYLVKLVLRQLHKGLEYITKNAMKMQKYYMRWGSSMDLNASVQQFVERLNDLNRSLLYFPGESTKQLDQDKIIEILDQAKALDPE